MRAELEYKIIGSVLLLGGESREKIFTVIDDSYFSDDAALRIYRQLRRLCREHPNIEYEALVSGLDREDQAAILSAVSALMSPNGVCDFQCKYTSKISDNSICNHLCCIFDDVYYAMH